MFSLEEFESTTDKSFETFTHYNGDRPFKIIINTGLLKIYSKEENKEGGEGDEGDEKVDFLYTKLVKISGVAEYWKGFDCAEGIHGNTFLAYIGERKGKHRYIYVSGKIIEFLTEDKIHYFSSVMGNSDVPYPIAYGKKIIYLLYECQYIYKSDLPIQWSRYCNLKRWVSNPWHCNDVSGIFYGHIKDCWDKKPLTIKIYSIDKIT